ncbi:diguanylate cyclase (GGDEF) domain-containing protein [Marinitoga piezophila KA3]|uniref:Diguanylate cyclase (GGDEF) domain-containing protein n=1 Tax=Marinitoga piezophila (strain DSM 14283 / JCM 11233 / KA3) TaxID=443254 RepID=H2J5D5_MARPK|nr:MULTISPECIES: GGDEF domain-containing protein [Marinitoga]AEX86079.1 diguanylate cyclase (GGDEF) domain-containing protein [Marinitoga piezophila KA3]
MENFLFNGKFFNKQNFISLFFSIVLIYFFPINFSFEIKKLLAVLLITFISDNIDVKWKNNIRLVTNMTGFLVASLYGRQYILVAAITTLFRLERLGLNKRVSKFLGYFFMNYGGYVLADLITDNIYLKLFLFVTFSKLINTLHTDLDRFDFNMLLTEYVFFLTLLPSMYFYLLCQNHVLKIYFIFQNLIFIILYYFIMKHLTEREEEKIKNERLKRFNDIMLQFSNILYSYSMNVSKEKISKDVANILNKQFGYKYVLISEIDYENDKINRITYAGLSEIEFNKLKETKVKASDILKLFANEYRYGEVYFIPAEKGDFDEQNYYFQFESNITLNTYTQKKNQWHPNDLLLITIRDKENEIIGYISCDQPKNGLRPTEEDMKILSVLSKIVSIILIHSKQFKYIKKLSETDYLTSLYNSSKLNKDIKFYNISNIPISLAFIDLDDFKKINDTYGHVIGDEKLKEFAFTLKSSVRDIDKVYRYGGDEFVIIFENLNKKQAKKILERIKRKLIETGLSFSVGIEDTYETDISNLIKIADKKAYEAKNSGKNKIIL